MKNKVIAINANADAMVSTIQNTINAELEQG